MTIRKLKLGTDVPRWHAQLLELILDRVIIFERCALLQPNRNRQTFPVEYADAFGFRRRDELFHGRLVGLIVCRGGYGLNRVLRGDSQHGIFLLK